MALTVKLSRQSKYKYSEQDFIFDIGPHLKEYMRRWVNYYSNERFFGWLEKKTAKDFVISIKKEFL